MDDNTLSTVINVSASVCFVLSAWACFWIWRARRGGWARLAAAYPTPSRRDSLPRRWHSMSFRPAKANYPGLITFRLTVDGLYAVPSIFVRFGHDPILVPWDDIEILAVDTYPADRLYDLKFARVPQIRARVNVAAAQLIRRAADNSQYFAEQQVAVHTVSSRAVPAKPAAAPRPLRHQSVA